VAQVRLLPAGTDGDNHRVTFRVMTSLGNTYQVEVDVLVRSIVRVGLVPKHPLETFKVATDFLHRLATGETLSSQTVTATNLADGTDSSVTLLAQTAVSGSVAHVRVKAGAAGQDHRVQMRVVTSLGNTYEAELDMLIRDQ
jgi:hypothetical protein